MKIDFDRVPINAHLGLRLLECGSDRVRIEMDATTQLMQEHGVVHGGILALLADTAAVYLIQPSLAADQRMASIEFKVNFLAPARGGARLVAEAEPIRRGKRIAVCEARVSQDDAEVLRGIFTYAIL